MSEREAQSEALGLALTAVIVRGETVRGDLIGDRGTAAAARAEIESAAFSSVQRECS